jgi:hypothetical protein
MLQINEASVGFVDPAQAASLSLLVDLEARWENLRASRSRDPQVGSSLQDLQSKQKAYEAFRTRLAAYNKRFKPAHVPELLLNTPSRLGTWCRSMRALYVQVENNPQGHCPVHLLEKAYRWADQLGKHMNKPLASRPTPPANIGSAIRELEALGQWCQELASVAAPVPPTTSNVALLG